MTREQARAVIENLVSDFQERYAEFHATDYKEHNIREGFINPFFAALGWDVENRNQISEAYREVIPEDSLKIKGKTKAPDYGFRLQGSDKKRLFFVEAKKPGVSLKVNKEASYQLRRYGRSAQAPVSILTNFEEFVVYDCTKRPHKDDNAGVARIKYISYLDYLQEFDFIYDTFSHEAVLKGRFEKFVVSDTYKKGTQTLDKDFVESLDGWRKYLATTIARLNVKLNEDEINFVVQQTIDRLIFLRFCEDRGVEVYGHLQAAAAKGNVYANLFEVFKHADDKYNSGLFDFKKDTISAGLKIDNKVLKEIIKELYYPDCEYDFRVMPVEVLGNAYEQFLGKVITVNTAHHATIEEKPEIRKAGGVYYTPQYIVEYIVNNTLGKLIEGKTPQEIEKIKIVDPACGSGSFLLGAYDHLLNYHINWYHQKGYATKKIKDNPLTPGGTLSTAEKKKILTNNIFGVDLDANAVEVTKLSLLLKCVEGETEASIKQQFSVFHERILPNLDNNIKDGNSLIDTDFYDGEMDLGYERKIKPFSWKKAFPEVFKQGGFDVVIGNPPYVRQELLDDTQKEYFAKKYQVYHGTADLYAYFFEKGIGLLNETGLFGIIVANKWMRTNYGEPLRKWSQKQNIKEIIDFGDLPVFQQVTTYPCIFIAGKGKPAKRISITNVKTLEFDTLGKYIAQNKMEVESSSLNDDAWNLAPETEKNLLKKIQAAGIRFSEYVKGKNYRGVLTGLNEAFVIDSATKTQLIKEDKASAEIIKPFLAGRDIKRYQPLESDSYLIFAKRGIDINKYPAVKGHLQKFKKQLTPKPKDFKGSSWEGRKPGTYKWYEIQDAVDYYEEFEKPKIIYPNILKQPEFTFDTKGWYTNQKCFIIPLDDKYLLGFLNSKLNHYLFEQYLPKLRGGFYEPSYVIFKNFPIKKIDFSNKNEKAKHDEIVALVELLLKLNEELKEEKLQSKAEQIKQRIAHSEEKINQLVYQLYDLNEADIKIIEAGI